MFTSKVRGVQVKIRRLGLAVLTAAALGCAVTPALAGTLTVTILGSGSPIPSSVRFSQSILIEAGKDKLLPDVFFSRIAARMLAIDPLARSSMWDDLAAGRRTEVDYINGEIVAMAEAAGGSAPVNARLCALVHAAGPSPQRWDAAALLAALREAGRIATS